MGCTMTISDGDASSTWNRIHEALGDFALAVDIPETEPLDAPWLVVFRDGYGAVTVSCGGTPPRAAAEIAAAFGNLCTACGLVSLCSALYVERGSDERVLRVWDDDNQPLFEDTIGGLALAQITDLLEDLHKTLVERYGSAS